MYHNIDEVPQKIQDFADELEKGINNYIKKYTDETDTKEKNS